MRQLIIMLVALGSFTSMYSVEKKTGGRTNKMAPRREVIDIKPSELRETGDMLEYCSDCNVKQSSYTKYYFSKSELSSLMGNYKGQKRLRITYSVAKTESENYTPDDPNVQAPSGGFTYTLIYCKISKVE